jgi:transketolase
VRESGDDKVTVVAMGTTVHEALKAADQLADEGINIRVVDAYSVKPIDANGLRDAVRATGGKLVVVEDHYPEGGLGEATLSALEQDGAGDLSYRHLAVNIMPGSGKPAELLKAAGIDADAIASAVRELA